MTTFICSCGDSDKFQIKRFHANGNLECLIELNKWNDTIAKTFYRTDGSIRDFLPFENNQLHGIANQYDRTGTINQRQLFVNGVGMCVTKSYRNGNNVDSVLWYHRLVNDSLFETVGFLFYDSLAQPVGDKSYMYSIRTKSDTIGISDYFTFDIETFSLDKDSMYSQIAIGNINPDYSISDTLYCISQWSRDFKFKVKPKKRGRNYVMGTLTTVVLYPELKDYASDTMAVFFEYYVR